MAVCLISVSDKTGLTEIGKALSECNVKLVASGGTCKNLRDSGLVVSAVEDITHFKEMLGGRVKTLHPAVHGSIFLIYRLGGILARRDLENDTRDLVENGIEMIDFVICNLYPFEKCVQKDSCKISDAIEEVDIGGVTLLRAGFLEQVFNSSCQKSWKGYSCVRSW